MSPAALGVVLSISSWQPTFFDPELQLRLLSLHLQQRQPTRAEICSTPTTPIHARNCRYLPTASLRRRAHPQPWRQSTIQPTISWSVRRIYPPLLPLHPLTPLRTGQ